MRFQIVGRMMSLCVQKNKLTPVGVSYNNKLFLGKILYVRYYIYSVKGKHHSQYLNDKGAPLEIVSISRTVSFYHRPVPRSRNEDPLVDFVQS